MALTYNNDVKNDRLQVVIDAIGAGGKLEIGTAGMSTLLVSIPLDDPSFVAGGAIMTLQGVPLSANAVADGVPAAARIVTAADVVIVDGLTVGTSGAMITVSASPIVNGSEIRVEAGAIAHG